MPVTLEWANDDQTALYMTFIRPWTWSDLFTQVAAGDRLMDEVSHPVDLILNVRESGFPPDGALWRFHKLAANKHRNRGHVIFVGANDYVRTLANVLVTVFDKVFQKREFHFVATQEEALALARQNRANQPVSSQPAARS